MASSQVRTQGIRRLAWPGGIVSMITTMRYIVCPLFSDGQYWRIAGRDDDDEEPAKKNRTKASYILLYEDNEGDRMLVGDVPWE